MTRRQRIAVIALLAGAALVRVLLVVTLEKKPFFYKPVIDSAAYDRWADEIAHRDFVGKQVFYQDPLYPYFLGVIYKIFGRDLLLVRFIQVALGVLGCWMIFESARRLADFRVGIVALCLAALYKPFIFYEAALLKEFLGVILVEAAILMLVLARERRWAWAAAGFAFGLAILVRANLLLVVAALAIFFFVRHRGGAALLAAGVLAAVLPVTIRNAVVGKDLVVTTSQFGQNLYIGNHPGNTTGRYVPPPFLTAANPEFEEPDFRREAERSRRRTLRPSEVSSYWVERTSVECSTRRFFKLTFKRLTQYLNAYEVPDNTNIYFYERFSWVLKLPLAGWWLVAPLAGFGLVVGARRWGWLTLLVAAYLVSIIFFFVFGRYRLPMIPPLIIFAALGAVTLFDQIRARKILWGAVAGGAVALVLAVIPSYGGRDFRAAHFNLGLYYYEEGKPSLAAEELEKAGLAGDPRWHYLRGLCYEQSGDAPRALEAFTEASRLDAGSVDAAMHLALAYEKVGNDSRAVEEYARAIRLAPGMVDLYLAIGRVYLRMNRPDNALEAYRAAPECVEIWLEMARLYDRLGMAAEAEEVRRRARQNK